MIIKWLIIHQVKESIRSVLRYQNLAANILFGFLLFLLTLNFLSLGLAIDRILELVAPDRDPLELFNGFLLYYLAIDLLMRFVFQRIPAQAIKPYLHLPLSKSKIIHFLLIKSALTFLNFFPLLVFIPFAVKIVLPAYSAIIALVWLLTITCCVLINGFLNFYFKKQLLARPRRLVVYLAVLIGLIILDFYKIISLSALSGSLFGQLLSTPFIALVFLAGLIGIYLLNFQFLKTHRYPGRYGLSPKQISSPVARFQFLEQYGLVGEFLALELKLLFRNKRSRSSVIMAFAILLIGFLFYNMIPVEDNFYPEPGSYSKFNADNNLPANFKQVSVKVIAGNYPEKAHLFITGNQDQLGNWDPAIKPLLLQKDSSWARTIALEAGTKIKYKFTLGDWGNQRLTAEGQVPVYDSLLVKNDTTLVHHAANWDIPKRSFVLDFNLLYVGLMMTGMLMLVYGQFMLSWESSYFDAILARKIDYNKYFRAKYILLVFSAVLFYIITLPYGFFGMRIIYMNSAIVLYNIGVNTFVLFFLSSFTRKRLDLSASVIGTQGKGANQYLTVLPTLILPILIYLPFGLNGHDILGLYVLAILGIIGILFNRPLLQLVVKNFYRQKYNISAGFRQS